MPPRQLDVEGVEVDVVDALKELGGPGVGQGLGQVVSPSAPARALPRGQVLGSEARPPERAPGASHGSTARRTTSSFMSTRGLKPSPLQCISARIRHLRGRLVARRAVGSPVRAQLTDEGCPRRLAAAEGKK